MRPVFIYTLNDPVTSAVRYVGLTRDPKRRIAQYRHGGHTPHLRNWLKSVEGKPSLVIVEETTEALCDQREQYWIKYYRDLAANLINYTMGGERSCGLSEEKRAEVSARQKAYYASRPLPYHSPAARAKAKASQQGKRRPWSGARFRALNIARRGIPLSSQHKAKVSAALAGRKCPWMTTPEARERARQRWDDPVYRAAMVEPRKRAAANPAGRIASAEKRCGVPLTEEHRRRISEAMKGRRNTGLAEYWAAKTGGK